MKDVPLHDVRPQKVAGVVVRSFDRFAQIETDHLCPVRRRVEERASEPAPGIEPDPSAEEGGLERHDRPPKDLFPVGEISRNLRH